MNDLEAVPFKADHCYGVVLFKAVQAAPVKPGAGLSGAPNGGRAIKNPLGKIPRVFVSGVSTA